ncbi:MAG: hypothetical protein WA081_15295 [Desulfosalsimonadaceae bacterium]
MELEKFLFVGFDFLEFFPQGIEKKWAYEFQDVFFTGIVRAEIAAGGFVHDGLKQGPENGRGNAGPVRSAAIQKTLAHGGVKSSRRKTFRKQFPVDIGKGGKLFVEVFKALVLGCVQQMKQRGEMVAQIAPVFMGALLQILLKLLALKDAGVVGKQAKQQANQVMFQGVAGIADIFQLVVQAAHALGGLDIDRVLLPDGVGLVSGDKAEKLHLFVQVFQFKIVLGVVFQIVKTEPGEVGNNDVLGQVPLFQAGEIIEGLLMGAVKILAPGFVLDEQHSFPEQINIPVTAVDFLHALFKTSHTAAADAEYMKKLVPESFGLGVFGGHIGPGTGEGQGAGFDFIPA